MLNAKPETQSHGYIKTKWIKLDQHIPSSEENDLVLNLTKDSVWDNALTSLQPTTKK